MNSSTTRIAARRLAHIRMVSLPVFPQIRLFCPESGSRARCVCPKRITDMTGLQCQGLNLIIST